MDIDKAHANRLCFHCGEKGHMAKKCPNQKQQVRATMMDDGNVQINNKKEDSEEDFQETQQ